MSDGADQQKSGFWPDSKADTVAALVVFLALTAGVLWYVANG
jgi:hypothetical protein